jgi:hypothetical protein
MVIKQYEHFEIDLDENRRAPAFGTSDFLALVQKYKNYFQTHCAGKEFLKKSFDDGQVEDDEEATKSDEQNHLIDDQIDAVRKQRIKILDRRDINIFWRMKGFPLNGEDVRISNQSFMYAVDSTHLHEKIHNSKKFEKISFSISGGIVVPNTLTMFRRKFDADVNETVKLFVGDFTSLYPTTMQFANICPSAISYSTRHAIRVGNRLYNPFNEQVFMQVCSPVKINSSFIGVAVFIVRPSHYVSVCSRIIGGVIKKRAEIKKLMKKAGEAGDFVQASVYNTCQNALKLLINTMYGIQLKSCYFTSRPYQASLVPYYGRVALMRFYFTIYHYFYEKKCNLSIRGPIGGDTDSLFLRCTEKEMKEIIEMFAKWPANRGIYNVEIDKMPFEHGFFLNKKNYILQSTDKKGKFALLAKNTFRKNQCVPSRQFMETLLHIIFSLVVPATDLPDNSAETEEVYKRIDQKLVDAMQAFNSSPASLFKHTSKMSKDLRDYKTMTAVLKQLSRLTEEEPTFLYVRGSEVSFSHYAYVFSPPDSPHVGPINYKNLAQIKFVHSHPLCTALADDLFEYRYKPILQKLSIDVDRSRSLHLDLHSLIDKIIEAMKISAFEEHFKSAFEQVFGKPFFTCQDLKKAKNVRKRQTTENDTDGGDGQPTILDFIKRQSGAFREKLGRQKKIKLL